MASSFGERLKELREERDLTAKELARRVNLHHSAICRWELGEREPLLCNVIQLAKFFDVTLDYIAGLTEYS